MTNGQIVSSDLIVTAITTSQAGQYTCTVTLSGYTYSDSTNIIVQSKFSLSKMIIYLSTIPVSVPTPMIIASVTGTVYAGIPLTLSCDYIYSEYIIRY